MVIIILGSKTDLNWGKEIAGYLSNFGIKYIIHIASAHKTPQHLLNLLEKYEKLRKPLVYICVAGRSNALGGFVDGQVTAAVINCPPYSEKYAGLDILSSLRMPSGIGALTVLEPDQAALAAAKILWLTDKKLFKKVQQYQKEFREKVINDDKKI